MKKRMNLTAMMLSAIFLCTFDAYAGMSAPTQVINLGDKTIEYAQTGYSNNPNLENLEYWFSQNGITNTDGSAINPVTNQSQAELFYTDAARQYEVEYLGIGSAAYHSPFGVFTYNGNPYDAFDKTKLTFYDPLFIQNEVPKDTKYTFTVEADTYFGFYLNSNDRGTMLTTMVANNPKPYDSSNVVNKADYTQGFDNAILFATNKGYTIAFEDIIGAGDADWEDLVININPTDGSGFGPDPSAAPEPATAVLLLAGLISLAISGRRKLFCTEKIIAIKRYIFSAILCAVFLSSSAMASPVVLQYVPAYDWYHGCAPTSGGMIMGYWDLHGYDNLFDASGWDAVKVTDNAEEQISSSAHNAKYDPTPDNSGLPKPPKTSLADFLFTSEGSLEYGRSYISLAADAFANYASYRGYQFEASNKSFSTFSWSDYTAEINAGRPMALSVDSNSDGTVDHMITAIGYEDRGADGLWYAAYSTWSESESDIYWEPFRGLNSSWNWGIDTITLVKPISAASAYTLPGETPQQPVIPDPAPIVLPTVPDNPAAAPEPATMLLLGIGLLSMVGLGRKK